MAERIGIILLIGCIPHYTFARRGAEDYYGNGDGIYFWLFLGAVILVWLVVRDSINKRTDRKIQEEFDAKKAKKENEIKRKQLDLERRESMWQNSRIQKFSGSIEGFPEEGDYRVIKSYKRVKTKGGSTIPQDFHEFSKLSVAEDFYNSIIIERDESKSLVVRASDPNSVNYGTSYESYDAVILNSWWTKPSEKDSGYYKIFPERHPYVQYRKSIDADI